MRFARDERSLRCPNARKYLIPRAPAISSTSTSIPSDRIVPLAVNRGNPAVLAEPKAEFSKAVRAMAKELVAAQAVAKQKKKFMATLARA